MAHKEPTRAHLRLASLTGRWRGPETIHPDVLAGGSGDAIEATGTFVMRLDPFGLHLIADYDQVRNGEMVMAGHAVYGWNAAEECYTLYWVDSGGDDPQAPLRGTWDAGGFVFEGESALGRYRHVYSLPGGGAMSFRLEYSQDGGDTWQCFVEGNYHRATPAEIEGNEQ